MKIGLPDTNPDMREAIAWLRQLRADLWDHPDRVPFLPEPLPSTIIRHFLDLACLPSGASKLIVGRGVLSALPREWLVANVRSAAADLINLDDEWEYRRFLEVCQALDLHLLQEFVAAGTNSANPEVREAAVDFSGAT